MSNKTRFYIQQEINEMNKQNHHINKSETEQLFNCTLPNYNPIILGKLGKGHNLRGTKKWTFSRVLYILTGKKILILADCIALLF